MTSFALSFVAATLLIGGAANANTVKLKTWDAVGTVFVVMVDWESGVVSTKLRANPARLSGQRLEQSLQKAVYYGSAVGCKMLEAGRRDLGRGKTLGALHCPWFR